MTDGNDLVDINLFPATCYPKNATKRTIRRPKPIVSQWFPSFAASSAGDWYLPFWL